MRKFLIGTSLAAVMSFGGCATTSSTDIAATIAQVQQIAVQICAFIPTAATVAGILATGNPAVATASAAAAAICAAVTPAKAAGKLRGVPTVSGVVIHGRFIN